MKKAQKGERRVRDPITGGVVVVKDADPKGTCPPPSPIWRVRGSAAGSAWLRTVRERTARSAHAVASPTPPGYCAVMIVEFPHRTPHYTLHTLSWPSPGAAHEYESVPGSGSRLSSCASRSSCWRFWDWPGLGTSMRSALQTPSTTVTTFPVLVLTTRL